MKRKIDDVLVKKRELDEEVKKWNDMIVFNYRYSRSSWSENGSEMSTVQVDENGNLVSSGPIAIPKESVPSFISWLVSLYGVEEDKTDSPFKSLPKF